MPTARETLCENEYVVLTKSHAAQFMGRELCAKGRVELGAYNVFRTKGFNAGADWKSWLTYATQFRAMKECDLEEAQRVYAIVHTTEEKHRYEIWTMSQTLALLRKDGCYDYRALHAAGCTHVVVEIYEGPDDDFDPDIDHDSTAFGDALPVVREDYYEPHTLTQNALPEEKSTKDVRMDEIETDSDIDDEGGVESEDVSESDDEESESSELDDDGDVRFMFPGFIEKTVETGHVSIRPVFFTTDVTVAERHLDALQKYAQLDYMILTAEEYFVETGRTTIHSHVLGHMTTTGALDFDFVRAYDDEEEAHAARRRMTHKEYCRASDFAMVAFTSEFMLLCVGDPLEDGFLASKHNAGFTGFRTHTKFEKVVEPYIRRYSEERLSKYPPDRWAFTLERVLKPFVADLIVATSLVDLLWRRGDGANDMFGGLVYARTNKSRVVLDPEVVAAFVATNQEHILQIVSEYAHRKTNPTLVFPSDDEVCIHDDLVHPNPRFTNEVRPHTRNALIAVKKIAMLMSRNDGIVYNFIDKVLRYYPHTGWIESFRGRMRNNVFEINIPALLRVGV